MRNREEKACQSENNYHFPLKNVKYIFTDTLASGGNKIVSQDLF